MSVYKPKNSPFYQCDFWIDGRRFCRTTKATTRSAAKQREKELKREIRTAIENAARRRSPMTLAAALKRYWDEHGQYLRSRESEWQKMRRIRESEEIDINTLLADIDDPDIASHVARRRAQENRNYTKAGDKPLIGNATINREVEFLRRLFRRADKHWKVDVGEMPDWQLHLLDEPQGRTRELSDKEERNLYKHLRADFQPFIRFAIRSGLRLTNIIRLTWKQVDFEAGVIRVLVKSKKPGGTEKALPLTGEMVALLQGQKGSHPIYVFTYRCKRSRGKRRKGERYPFSQNGWRKEVAKALKAADIEDYTFHDNRHTAGSRIQRAKHDLGITQRFLMHEDIQSTMRYTHVNDEDVLAAMRAEESRRIPEVVEDEEAKPLKKEG